MKLRTPNLLAGALACALLLPPAPPPASAAAPSGDRRKKKSEDTPTPTPVAKPTKSKDASSIPLPIAIGKPAANIRLPNMDVTGKLLSLLMAEKATRLDDERIKFEGMNMDFNKPDGKQDFHVKMPASIFDLKTHIITSDDPVEVRTADFELTGEKMEFNTLEREGRLIGNVRMVIHNLKKFSGVQDEEKKSE